MTSCDSCWRQEKVWIQRRGGNCCCCYPPRSNSSIHYLFSLSTQIMKRCVNTHSHAHTHTHIYIYIMAMLSPFQKRKELAVRSYFGFIWKLDRAGRCTILHRCRLLGNVLSEPRPIFQACETLAICTQQGAAYSSFITFSKHIKRVHISISTRDVACDSSSCDPPVDFTTL